MTKEEYHIIEGHLRFKTSDIRQYTLHILNRQTPIARLQTAERLLGEKKEECRLGGLSMLQSIKADEKMLESNEVKELFEEIIQEIGARDDLSQNEMIIVNDLIEQNEATNLLESDMGLFDPDVYFVPKIFVMHPNLLQEFFHPSRSEERRVGKEC